MKAYTKDLLKENERIDQLIREDLGIIQNSDYFSFSVDALLLADFVRLPKRDNFNYIDFCSGNGIIPLLLSDKTTAKLKGIELQAPLVDMAKRSVKLNRLENQIEFIHSDIKELRRDPHHLYDIVTCNPPYFLIENSHKAHKLTSHALARHEIELTLEDWVKKAGQVMRMKGKLFIVHRPERLDDLTEVLLRYHFSIHRLKFVYPKIDANAKVVLIEAILGGGRNGVKVEPPLVIHNEDGSYTKELEAIYYGE